MANEILVTSIQPLGPDESRYALSFVTKGHSFRRYDWDGATALVDRVLDSCGGPDTSAA